MSNLYMDRFNLGVDDEESISFEYEVIDGVIQPVDEDTHFGGQILTDEETMKWIKKLIPLNGQNESGMISIYDDIISIERLIKR